MNETGGPESPAAALRRSQEARDFLQRTLNDVEIMRAGIPKLVKGEESAWQELRFCAQRAAGGAFGHQMGILRACARELVALADEKFAGAKLDDDFLLSVTSAIEMIALEAIRVTRELR